MIPPGEKRERVVCFPSIMKSYTDHSIVILLDRERGNDNIDVIVIVEHQSLSPAKKGDHYYCCSLHYRIHMWSAWGNFLVS